MLEQRILDFFQYVCPVRAGDALLVAVSGGPDSVALLHLLLEVRDELGVRLEVAHLDHGLRGQESTGDAEFVRELAADCGLTLHSRRIDLPARHDREGGSLEALSRRERYAFLDEARAVAGAHWIVTGHSANDQVETFLMNLLRGAGPRGLGGMLPVGPGPLCRPLLTAWREEILAFLEENDLPYREDSSNEDLALTRNRIRHTLVPLLEEEFDPSVLRTLARESQFMNELDEHLSLESDRILGELVEEDPEPSEGRIRVNVPALQGHPRVLQRSALRAALEELAGGLESITLSHLDACLDLVHRQEGRGQIDLPNGLLVRREYASLVLTSREEGGMFAPPEPSSPLDLTVPGETRWGRVHLRWRVAETRELSLQDWPEGPNRGGFDLEAVARPVYLRGVRAGDRLEPMGMEGSQKLSDFFINLKVPRPQRTWVPLLCDNGGPERGERILWVVGRRRSRHAPVAPDTSQVVLFQADTIV